MKVIVKPSVKSKSTASENAAKLLAVLKPETKSKAKPAIAAKPPKDTKPEAKSKAKAPKKPAGFTYRNNEMVRDAKAWGARKLDIVEGKGLKKGQIIETTHGFCVLERDLPGMSAKVVPFKANGKVEWNGVTVPAMHLSGRNYVAAQWKTKNGSTLVNVEIDRFSGQNPKTKAVLVQ